MSFGGIGGILAMLGAGNATDQVTKAIADWDAVQARIERIERNQIAMLGLLRMIAANTGTPIPEAANVPALREQQARNGAPRHG